MAASSSPRARISPSASMGADQLVAIGHDDGIAALLVERDRLGADEQAEKVPAARVGSDANVALVEGLGPLVLQLLDHDYSPVHDRIPVAAIWHRAEGHSLECGHFDSPSLGRPGRGEGFAS